MNWDKILTSWVDGGWTMIPLALVAVVLYANAVQLLLYLARRGYDKLTEREMMQWIRHPERAEGEVGEVIRYTQDETTSVDEIQNRFAEVVSAKIPEVDRRLAYVNVLVAAAPLLGLLGTVLGMLVTFQGIAASGGKMADMIARGISEALITTEMGLLIALPGLMLSYMVKRKRNEYVAFLARLESLTVQYRRKNLDGDDSSMPAERTEVETSAPGFNATPLPSAS